MDYYLMHKDEKVAILNIDNNFGVINKGNTIEKELLPLCAQERILNDIQPIKLWWQNRAVSKKQSKIKSLLQRYQIPSTEKLLLDNLALSFSDCYWVCPKGVDLKWKDVTLFSNPFESNLEFQLKTKEESASTENNIHSLIGYFTPVASTGGELEKKWKKTNGQIYLVKGNMPGNSFQQSLNEVFASAIHRQQGFKNYVEYQLVNIEKNTMGCKCECFTSENVEFIPAWELFSKYKKPNNQDAYLFYIACMEKEGINETKAKEFLDYQTTIDFLITNIDRHLNNFGILRDSNTLKTIGPAPIYDSGNSMLYKNYLESTPLDFMSLKVNALCNYESLLISKVSDFKNIDFSKLPTKEYIKNFYKKDETLSYNLERMADTFEYKQNIVRILSKGMPYKTVESGLKHLISKNESNNSTNAINQIIEKNGIESFLHSLEESEIR